MDNRPIGVFDSGLGGLTATGELMRLMPDENIIYLGDSIHMPYGEKPQAQVLEFSRQILKFLLEKDVKAVFIACGTATSAALEALKKESSVPVVGVVEPACAEAVSATKNGKIGLLATTGSVFSGSFQRCLGVLAPRAEVTASACPRFAGMVEEGIFEKDDPRVQAAAAEYLPVLKRAGVDTVILGCTHYPLLSDIILEYMGLGVKLISSGAAAARSIRQLLISNNCQAAGPGGAQYYTTGDERSFAETAKFMLGRDISGQLKQIAPLSL